MRILPFSQIAFAITLPALLCLATVSGAAGLTDRGNDAWITRQALQTATGHQIPPGAWGIVVVERPRAANLLKLHGMAGQGYVILRGDHARHCLRLRIRFAAGNFDGQGVSGHLADPVLLTLQSRRIARQLARGQDIVSEALRVSETPHPDADIVIRSGLRETYGFVFNPGRNILADLFGPRLRDVPCQPA